ncbi:hypothetical protein [Marinoscillum luteum]|uniref:Ada DNA repair metal-binding domain-containing protein n=1 Tax=Marinoscillum luteum TaxID=861051 RepID=A0ABW7NCL4_9BACT
MMMKPTFQDRTLFVFLLFLVACTSAYTQEAKVFVTDTGTKYHRENCKYLRYSRSELTIKSAKEKGYEACKVCKPSPSVNSSDTTSQVTQKIQTTTKPTSSPGVSRRCSATTQAGAQCKRMTKSSSGKCWQHE